MTISTVTTERLKKIASWRETYGDEASVMIPAPEAKQIVAELLAVREAQPVAYRYRYNGKHLASVGCGDMVSSWKYCEEADLVNPDERYESQELFTAQPAPAVPGKPRLSPRMYADCVNMLQEMAIAFHGTGQLRERINSVLGQYVEPDHPHTRAAMLQPVSQGEVDK